MRRIRRTASARAAPRWATSSAGPTDNMADAQNSLSGRRMLSGVHHVGMATADLDRLQAFYCDLLGMRLITTGEWSDSPVNDSIVGLPRSVARFVLLAAGNLALEIFEYSSPP